MAEHIDYFARFCEVVSRHLTALPELGPHVKGKLSYLMEDMDDAIDMADQDASAAREALVTLREAAAAAKI
jgi:hypothetical protein